MCVASSVMLEDRTANEGSAVILKATSVSDWPERIALPPRQFTPLPPFHCLAWRAILRCAQDDFRTEMLRRCQRPTAVYDAVGGGVVWHYAPFGICALRKLAKFRS